MTNANGRSSKRYVQDNRRIRDTLPHLCSWCGEWIDVELPTTHAMSWTTDHTVALADGGSLYGERTLMHRSCNTKKERERRRKIITTEDW